MSIEELIKARYNEFGEKHYDFDDVKQRIIKKRKNTRSNFIKTVSACSAAVVLLVFLGAGAIWFGSRGGGPDITNLGENSDISKILSEDWSNGQSSNTEFLVSEDIESTVSRDTGNPLLAKINSGGKILSTDRFAIKGDNIYTFMAFLREAINTIKEM